MTFSEIKLLVENEGVSSKIAAIKAIRDRTGLGLKEAKMIVDAAVEEMKNGEVLLDVATCRGAILDRARKLAEAVDAGNVPLALLSELPAMVQMLDLALHYRLKRELGA